MEPLQLVLFQPGIGFSKCLDHCGLHSRQHGLGLGLWHTNYRHASIHHCLCVGRTTLQDSGTRRKPFGSFGSSHCGSYKQEEQDSAK